MRMQRLGIVVVFVSPFRCFANWVCLFRQLMKGRASPIARLTIDDVFPSIDRT
jgi:hypothetical protein